MKEVPAPIITAIPEYSVKGQIYRGQMIEQYQPTAYGAEVFCDQGALIEFDSSKGVMEKEEQSLKSYCESSLGVKDVASFKAGLEGSVSRSISLTAEKTAKIKLHVDAPGCGSELHLAHQRVITYKLHTTKRKYFFKVVDVELPPFTEYTETYIARLHRRWDNPDCPCALEKFDFPIVVKLALNTRLTALIDGYVKNTGELCFEIGGKEYGLHEFEFGAPTRFVMSPIPEFYQALSGIESDSATVELTAFPEGLIADEDLLVGMSSSTDAEGKLAEDMS